MEHKHRQVTRKQRRRRRSRRRTRRRARREQEGDDRQDGEEEPPGHVPSMRGPRWLMPRSRASGCAVWRVRAASEAAVPASRAHQPRTLRGLSASPMPPASQSLGPRPRAASPRPERATSWSGFRPGRPACRRPGSPRSSQGTRRGGTTRKPSSGIPPRALARRGAGARGHLRTRPRPHRLRRRASSRPRAQRPPGPGSARPRARRPPPRRPRRAPRDRSGATHPGPRSHSGQATRRTRACDSVSRRS